MSDPQPLEIWSDDEQLSAHLYRPATDGPFPLVVMGGGWCYVKELAQPMYAEVFAEHGIASLVFDYRTMGDSTGEPRQHIDPWQQIDDYRNVISYAERLPDVDADRLGAWGISYSGGHALILAAVDSRLRATAAVVPVIDGYENMRLAHGTMSFRRLQGEVLTSLRRRQQTGEESYIPHASSDPVANVVTWPFPASEGMFERLKASQAPNYENRATARSTDMLLRYSVMPYAERIVDAAPLIVVAEGDDHTHWDLAMDAYNAIPTPEKALEVIPGSTHHTIYEDRDHLRVVAGRCASWFTRHLLDAR